MKVFTGILSVAATALLLGYFARMGQLAAEKTIELGKSFSEHHPTDNVTPIQAAA
jgi:hypothetical protein